MKTSVEHLNDAGQPVVGSDLRRHQVWLPMMRFKALATRPERNLTRLRYETVVPAPLLATFAFFSNAANLERLTPPWVQFSIVTPQPIVMRAGLEIDYRIRLRGLPLAWTSLIDVWEPSRRFVDRQIAGPYLWWRHEHRFEMVGAATRVIDEIEYLPRAAWMTAHVVRRDVERIFRYRQDALQQHFQHRRSWDGSVTMQHAMSRSR